MERILQYCNWLEALLWGPGMLALLLAAGIYFTLGTGFFQLRRAGLIIRRTLGTLGKKKSSPDGVTPFQAVSAALAGTMGTGNIAGIATALVAGGPGAIFWMWVSAFFGMMTKYAEVVLAVRYRRPAPGGGWQGGPMEYISRGLGCRPLAVLFCLLLVPASLGIGNAAQVHSAAAAMDSAFHIPPVITGLAMAAVTGLVLLGGIRRVGKVAENLVPLACIIYFSAGSLVLFFNRQEIPGAIALIMECAFSPRAALGGGLGYSVLRGMRAGIARGVFSNEAGLGSAPIAHASAHTNSPTEQGMWGIFEVFADTLVMCTFTALILLTSGNLWRSGLDGSALTAEAFTHRLGPAGGWAVALSLCCFGAATLFTWAYYGEQGIAFLTKGSPFWKKLYRGTFVAVAALSAGMRLEVVWNLSDLLNILMAIPNLLAVVSLSGEVFQLTKKEWG